MSTTVYIVEDDMTFAEVLEIYFNSLPEFTAIAFHSAHAALSRILAHPPDILILDIMMPGMRGDELAERVNEAGITCPIIILTGLLSPDEAERKNYKIGARVVAGKPVSLGVLKSLVCQQLGNPPGCSPMGQASC